MGDSSGVRTLSDSKVLEVGIKIIFSAGIILLIVIAIVSLFHIYTRVFWPSSSSFEPSYIINWRRRQQATTTTHQRRGSGLDQSTLDSLPIVSYNADDLNLKKVGGLGCCAICLCELQKGEKVRLLPKCNHRFHLECIGIWFKSHSSCPICRDDLVVVESRRTDSAVLTPPVSSGDGEEDHHDYGSGVENTEPPVVSVSFPSNVLFWRDETSGVVRSGSEKDGQSSSVASTSCNSNNGGCGGGGNSNGKGMLVIDVPAELCEDCSGLSTPTPDQDESTREADKFR